MKSRKEAQQLRTKPIYFYFVASIKSDSSLCHQPRPPLCQFLSLSSQSFYPLRWSHPHPTVAQQEAYADPQPNSVFIWGSPLNYGSYFITVRLKAEQLKRFELQRTMQRPCLWLLLQSWGMSADLQVILIQPLSSSSLERQVRRVKDGGMGRHDIFGG